MKGRLILAASSAAVLGFFIGMSFSIQMAPEVKAVQCPRRNGNADANSTSRGRGRGSNMQGRFWGPFRTAEESSSSPSSSLPTNATSEPKNVIARKMVPKAAERLPPDIVVSESDLHLRRIWGNHYDGKTTEWDEECAWSKNKAIHVSARKQAKWWYAKQFLHPSIVAPYDYVFLWDEDLDAASFDAGEYVRVVREHGLEI